jgi:HlyD family secretion protein
MTRRMLLLGLIAAIVIAAAGWWLTKRGGNEAFELAGNVEVRQVNLAFKVGGRIEKLLVDEGDRVSEGQTLALLDKVYFKEALAQIRAQRDQMAANAEKLEAGNRLEDIAQAAANVAEREATLVNAQQALDRADQLLKKGTGTRKTSDDARAARDEAQARLNSARQALRLMQIGFRKEDVDLARAELAEREASLKIIERQLTDAELKAPSPGIVLSRVREVGAIVNAGETVFVLSLISPIWVRSYVSEVDLGRIRPGMEVELHTDTAGLKPFKGQIGFISSTAEFTPKTVETRELRTALVYRLRVVVDDPDGFLRQGMPVTITVPPPRNSAVATANAQ